MFGGNILEVVIGLIFVFSLLAILVTQINGLISTALNLRAKQLKQGIQEMITDQRIQAKVLAHPIIDMVQATVVADANLSDEQAKNINRIEETDVSYIPPETFAEALIAILIAESDQELFVPFQRAIQRLPNGSEKSQLRELSRQLRSVFDETTLRQIYSVAQNLTDEKGRKEILAQLEEFENSLQNVLGRSDDMVPLLDGVSKIGDEAFQSAMRTILVSAQNLEEAKKQVKAWFGDKMDRVSARFATIIKRYSIVVALTLTVVLNVDTLHLGIVLWEDDDLRSNVAEAAREFDTSQEGVSLPSETVDVYADGSAMMIPIVEEAQDGTEGENNTEADDGTTLEDVQEQAEATQETLQTLLDLNLPIGWQYVTVTDEMVTQARELGLRDPRDNVNNIYNLIPGNSSDWLLLWVQKIIGIILTTIAASQGAPFWFDLLNRLTRRS